MAARYWVGGTGTWDATTTTKWSATDGGPGGASVPGTGDDVYFTSLSSGASYTVTRTATASVLSITMNGPATGTLTFAGTSTIGISTGNLTVGTTGNVSWTNTGILTKTGSGTITTNDVTINSPITINGTGISVTLGSNLTMGTGRTFTLGAGTLYLSGYTLSCGLFASTVSSTRSIVFGTNSAINLTSTASTTIWSLSTATGFTTSGTPTVNVTGAAVSGVTRILTHPVAAAQYIDFNITGGASGSTVNISSGNNITFANGYAGGVANTAGTITGDLYLSSTVSGWTANANVLTLAGSNNTITTNGKTIRCPITITGTTTLNDSLTVLSNYTVTVSGGFNTNGQNFSCGTFTITGGTLNTSAGTQFTASVATNIGTLSPYNPIINFIDSTVSLAATVFSSGDIITNGSNIVASTFNQTASSNATINSLNIASSASFTTTGLYTLGGYSTSKVAYLSLNNTINVHSMSVGGTDDLTNIYFAPSTSINLTGNATTIWNSISASRLDIVGTPNIRCTYSGATGTRTIIGDADLLSVHVPVEITAGSDIVNIYGVFTDVDFTGFSGTVAPGGTLTITSSLTIPPTAAAVTATAQLLQFNGPSVTLDTNGKSINMQVELYDGSLTLLSALNINSARTFSIYGGTFDTNGNQFLCGILNIGTNRPYNPLVYFKGNEVIVSGATTFQTGTVLCTNNVYVRFSTLTQDRDAYATVCKLDTTGAIYFETTGLYSIAGYATAAYAELDISNTIINCHSMAAGVGDDLTRIVFGTSGRINLTGNGTTVWTSTTAGGLTFQGTPDIRCTYSGSTGTRTILADTNTLYIQIPIKITAGSDTISGYGAFGSLDFSGFSGTIAPSSTLTITKSLNIPSTIRSVSSAYTLSFSGTTTLNTSGVVVNMPITLTSGSLTLESDLIMGSTQLLTIDAGTLNTNDYNITCAIISSSNSAIRTFNLGSSTITLTSTGTVWNLGTSTNATINPGTSTIILSNNTTTARLFAGGSKQYYNLVIGGSTSTSTTTISGSNSFNDLSSTKTVAHTVTFSGGATNTFANFNLRGSAGKLVTINASSTNTLVKSGSGVVDSDYLSLSASNAIPPNTWYAGPNSTLVSGVTGWIFDSPPTVSTSNSFFFGSNF